MNLLEQLIAERRRQGLSQRTVSVRAGGSVNWCFQLESDRHKRSPQLVTLERYAKALGVELTLKLAISSGAPLDSAHAERPAPVSA